MRAAVRQLPAARLSHLLHQASALPRFLSLQVPLVAVSLRAALTTVLQVVAVATVAAVLVLQAAVFPK